MFIILTLLDELDKDRNQLDCFSFSTATGDCKESSSVLGFLGAGGSDETLKRKYLQIGSWSYCFHCILKHQMTLSYQ